MGAFMARKHLHLILLGMVAVVLMSCTVYSSQTLSELRLTSHGANAIRLFPDYRVTNFNASVQAPEVMTVDFYDWAVENQHQIIPNPHPSVKFMRISQASTDPDVVRAVLVFNRPVELAASLIADSVVLRPAVDSPAESERTIVAASDRIRQESIRPRDGPESRPQQPKPPAQARQAPLPVSHREPATASFLELEQPDPSQQRREPDVSRIAHRPTAESSLESSFAAHRQFATADAHPAHLRDRASQLATRVSMPLRKPSASDNVLERKVSLQFEQQELMTILNALAVEFDLRVFADAGVRGRFSINARDVTLRELLKNLLLKRDFQYTLKGRDLTVISLSGETGRMARELLFRDLSLKDALQTLSKMMNVNLIIHSSVRDRRVNFYVENLSLDQLLELLVSTNNLVKKAYSDNTFVILERENAGDFGTRYYKTFKLINTTPGEVVDMIANNRSLRQKIDIENFSLNERINTLSMFDTQPNIQLVEQIIQSVDEKVQQAVIEVKLVEINRQSLQQMGIKLDNYEFNVADLGRLPSNYALPATLEFLEREDKANVLASPKIRAVHGRTATINIGEVIPVPYFRYETATNTFIGALPQVFKEYRDVQVGIRLEVTPHITRDNEISMDLNTTVDSVLSINEDGQIHRAERNTETFVRIKDGETVVLGGLINQRGNEERRSPSLLNRIPLLRGLVSHNKQDVRKTEMVMLVTPRLVNLGHQSDNIDTFSDNLMITND